MNCTTKVSAAAGASVSALFFLGLLCSASIGMGCHGSASVDSDFDSGRAELDAGPVELDTGSVEGDSGGQTSDVGYDATRAADAERDMGQPAWISAGCVSGGGLPEGETNFMLEDRPRKYVLRLPTNYDPDRAWPVVFALHGNGGNTSYWDSTGGARDIRSVLDESAILVVAEAIDNAWRDYDAPRETWPGRIESELVYFDHIIEELKSELCVDTRSIFAMGFSGGGSFSGVLGCRRDDIRAIAVGGSVIYFDEANCIGRPAAWVTIGEGELTESREAYRDFFRDRAGCGTETEATEPAPCVAYQGCDAESPVHYCQHPDGHIWPDFGTSAMWDFFAQFVE